MIHFTLHQEGKIVGIKCLYYPNILVMWYRPLGPSNARKRERERSKDPALLRPSPYQYLSLLYLSFWYLLPQLNSSFLPSSLSSVFWIYSETHFLPISLHFPEYSRAFPGYIPWLLKSLSSPLKSCPLAGLCPQRLPPSSLWYNHSRKSSWRGLPLKHTWSLDITVCIPSFHETVSVKASTVSPNSATIWLICSNR